MIYSATITTASLRVRESRIVAGLLSRGVDQDAWNDAVITRNVLQFDNEVSTRRVSGLVRARLESMDAEFWQLVQKGSYELATQAVFAAAVKNSRLLGDFLDITIREQRALFAKHLEPRMWTDYIEGCRGRDPKMPQWSESTIAKLRSAVFSMLAEAGYLKDTRSLLLQNVFLDPKLTAYLEKRGEKYVLRCMQVAQ